MSRRNREQKSRVKSLASRAALRTRLRAPRDRRGVLLLVVLSLLVLFMLIGTAFLMSSNQYKTSADASAKHQRVGNHPTALLDRALMQVLCDTGNTNSVVRSHSLLRDFYGSEGFEAVVYSPIDNFISASPNLTTTVSQVTRYATEPTGPYVTSGAGKSVDPTRRQLIDIYVRELAYMADDPLTQNVNEAAVTTALNAPDARHILKLERSVLGLPEMYNMPLTRGYFNGCLLTITSGPAAGQSTRIVDYQEVDFEPTTPTAGGILPSATTGTTAPFPRKNVTRLFRLRVMAFPNAEGSPLLIRSELPATDFRRSTHPARGLEIADLAGATFIVNGRPFSGTGAGFNQLARAGDPRLNAVETVGVSPDQNKWLFPEIALTPNPAYFFASDPVNGDAANDLWGARYFDSTKSPPNQYPALNPTSLTTDANNVNLRPLRWKYQTFLGPGDGDESYDAADTQNMALALQTVTPRARGRVVHGTATNPTSFEIDSSPEIIDNNGNYANTGNFLRLDLEDLPWPSFHRPDLQNYWFHRLVQYAIGIGGAQPDDAVRAVITPYGPDNVRGNADDPGVSLDVRDQIVAIKRKISLRPIAEDHPGFDGSNPASHAPSLDGSSGLTRNGNIAIPFWEAVGPWDVDNDNDGVPDSVWVDLGDNVQQAEDGTLYKPMYAFLIVDLDSRLNVNAHGLVDHLRSPQLDSTIDFNNGVAPGTNSNTGPGNLAHDLNLGRVTSNVLPHGSGYGPAEISLRPLLSPNLPGNADTVLRNRIGNPAYDDFARILSGRPAIDGQPGAWGRHGSIDVRGNVAGWTLANWNNDQLATREAIKVRPGIPFDVTNPATQAATLDRLTAFKFFGYPLWLSNYYGAVPTYTSFSQVPDLLGRYAIGLGYAGQPISEPYGDSLYTVYTGDPDLSLLYDTPYELDLSASRRRDTPDEGVTSAISVAKTAALNDDSPFATADLERILRAYDADSGILPDRLWNVVDAFDPLKLRANQPALANAAAVSNFGTAGSDEILAAAQQLASVNRRLVTTDSYDVPVPTNNFLKRLIYGADGQPGVAGVNDDDLGNPVGIDDPHELGWYNSDDWYAVMYHETPNAFDPSGEPSPPPGVKLEPQNPTIVDLLRYRVQYERRKRGVPLFTEQQLVGVAATLLPPEVLNGGKMDLNRPFGDGIDNAGDGIDNNGDGRIDEQGELGDPFDRANGVVDDPLEAGEPFVDTNGNGRRDSGEWFFNLINGNGQLIRDDDEYDGPNDQLWQGLANEPIRFNYIFGSVPFDLNGDGDYTDPGEGFAEGRLFDTPDGQRGRLRDNGLIQRQNYARQLYCMMMLLVDENYLASQNVTANADGNPNLETLYETVWQQIAYEIAERENRTPVAPDRFPTPTQADYEEAAPLAQQLALQKLTARRIAQWAINCVDFRDADAVMTPFEYDENPFDGWGVFAPDPANLTGPLKHFDLDGDVATNENWGQDPPYPRRFDRTKPIQTNTASKHYNVKNDCTAVNSTRGVVWGVERPELLITETLAFHDRNCTDEQHPTDTPPNHSFFSNNSAPPEERDYDLDQKLKPRGSLFIELYSPTSGDGAKPYELASQVAPAPAVGFALPTPAEGIMLNRLSNVGSWEPTTSEFKRSPVWRMSVVRDPIDGKLTNAMLTVADKEALLAQILTTDPDGYGFDSDQDSERLIYFSSGGDVNRSDDNDPSVEYQFDIELDQFVSLQANPNLRVRVPPIPVNQQIKGTSPVPMARRYFLARTELAPGPRMRDADVPIAPILPGRYAVVGTSGIQLDVSGNSTLMELGAARAAQWGDRYVTPLSRLVIVPSETQAYQPSSQFLAYQSLRTTRRIELWPSTDPNAQQILVAENGGQELVDTGSGLVNVFDSSTAHDPRASLLADGHPYSNRDGIPDSQFVQPAIAIPVEDMNISEPVEGYPSRRYQQMWEEANPGYTFTKRDLILNSAGEWEYDLPYNRPLDVLQETTMNGTTQNYRSVHLQRLANPMYPWNPPLYDEKGRANVMHRPELPINPYLTVDSQSVDLTAYNGATQMERSDMPASKSAIPVGDSGTSTLPNEDLFQRNYMAPLSGAEYAEAPDHILAGLLRELYRWSVLPARSTRWVTVEELRALGADQISDYLTELEKNKQGDANARSELDAITQWRWHQVPRTMPDDIKFSGAGGSYDESRVLKRFNLKSLERGAHYLGLNDTLEWQIAGNWLPRLLWKQERPNITLSLSQTQILTDLKNTRSRRVLTAEGPGDAVSRLQTIDHYTEKDRQAYRYMNDVDGPNPQEIPEHVVDFVLEQTLGFANESYAPKVDRTGGSDKQALLAGAATPLPGAPEIATSNLANPENGDLNKWNSVPAQVVVTTPEQELTRRQQLMESTFPWLTWNNRPFTSANELFHVPASSSSLMLREYSVANPFTADAYDGDGRNTNNSTGFELEAERIQRQKGSFGHLLNLFHASAEPAGSSVVRDDYDEDGDGDNTDNITKLYGAMNPFRILDFVEVPSRYVGTDTLLTPEVFNDPVGTDILSASDPRFSLQPPFNKVSRQRDPGRVNLNTVTGRRRVEANGFIRHWSEVYDGLMQRYGDGNLLDSASNVLQLSHFGPAWRDVVLSRKGYAEYYADPTVTNPVEKVDTSQVEPETYAFGLNRNFPSIFSNPFRGSDAGDLVPLPNMVRAGVETTLLRGIHWQRAQEDILKTNPFASSSNLYPRISWGIAGVDDDGNGLVDDIREAGWGIIEDPLPSDPDLRKDGDTLRVTDATQALEGSGIPLFSEQVPEPSIDGERNPGMMYQPMTRLGNLVTNRSNVYAIWVTVGYFEVERAPDFADQNVQRKFGGDGSWTPTTTNPSPASVRARALYDRVYPDGYTLGEELGTDTGNTRRERAFYIVDRTEPVGFKPGEKLNVDKMIRVRRRIE